MLFGGFVLTPQETEWGSRGSKTLTPMGSACLDCLTMTRRAFPWKSWSECVSEMSVNAFFKTQLMGALQSFRSQKQEFLLQDYHEEDATHVESYKDYTLMAEKTFKEKFEVAPADLGLEVVSMADERGRQISGVLIADEQPLRVRVSHRSSLVLSHLLQPHAHQLRPGQAEEYKERHMADKAKIAPKAFTKPEAAKSLEQIAQAATSFLNEKRAREEERRGLEALMVPEPPQEPQQQEEEEEEEEEVMDMAPALMLPAALGCGGKGAKGKGKAKAGRGKGKGKSKTKGSKQGSNLSRSAAATILAADDAQADADNDTQSVAASAASSAKSGGRSSFLSRNLAKGSPRSKLLEKARMWRRTIDIQCVLSKGQFGREVWQANQTLSALERDDTASTDIDTVLLKDHLALAKAAQELLLAKRSNPRKLK